MMRFFLFFFFNDTATTEIYTLSLHDALPISVIIAKTEAPPQHWLAGGTFSHAPGECDRTQFAVEKDEPSLLDEDRKSTRLNSSHANISYAVFCLKKKKNS